MNDSLQRPIRSFTNKNGKFQIICTKPANYSISAALTIKGDTVHGTATFYVPAKSMGNYRQVGTLTLAVNRAVFSKAPLAIDNSILVTGTIADKDGQPIKLTPFSFTSLDEFKYSFTSKGGSFQVICRNTGRYIVNIAGTNNNTGYFFTIPAGTKGHYDIGLQIMAADAPLLHN